MALWALAFPRDAIFMDDIAASPDQALVTVWTKRIFVLPHLPRQIARIDEAQSGFVSDLGGA